MRPTVCVCRDPRPDAIHECQVCMRPYNPASPQLMAARERWIARLVEAGLSTEVDGDDGPLSARA